MAVVTACSFAGSRFVLVCDERRAKEDRGINYSSITRIALARLFM